MKALSIRQPWAWAIVHGTKRVENRTWPTTFRGRFAIHAGKAYDGDEFTEEGILLDCPGRTVDEVRYAPRGAVVGFATVIDCVRPNDILGSQSSWANGPWCFVLADVVACDPISCKGMLGFFDVDVTEKAVIDKLNSAIDSQEISE